MTEAKTLEVFEKFKEVLSFDFELHLEKVIKSLEDAKDTILRQEKRIIELENKIGELSRRQNYHDPQGGKE